MNKNLFFSIKKFATAGSLLLSLLACTSPIMNSPIKSTGLVDLAVETEKRLDARIGLAVYDYHSGKRWEYNANDRFPLTSTFKALACAAVLERVDAGDEDLQRVVIVRESDLVPYAPVTEKRLGGQGMTLYELCGAAMSMSDNTAANLVLRSLGGPQGVTGFARRIGDSVTRLDRWEIELNQASPGDLQDTTTPNAMAQNLRRLVFGDVLSTDSRQQLVDWLVGNKVAGSLIRAGIPGDWRIGDRTGAGGYGSRSIIAVIWPPERKPVVAAIYMTETKASFDERNAAIAGMAKALKEELVR